jgi:hypothetical protein
MVGTICLAGREKARGGGLGLSFATFAVSSSVAGALVGAGSALIGDWLAQLPVARSALLSLVFATSFLYIAESLPSRGLPRPIGLSRQVSAGTWLRHSLPKTTALWGFQLGLGFTTRVNSWSFWVMAAALAYLGNPALGGLVGMTYGLMRGLQPTVTNLARSSGITDEHEVTDRLRIVDKTFRISGITGVLGLGAVILATI